MEKLGLPVVKRKPPPSKSLNMDDYLKFVELHLRYTLNRHAYRKWKEKSFVNVVFSLVPALKKPDATPH